MKVTKLCKFVIPIFLFLFFSSKTIAQNNLAAGDIAIVSYQSDFDQTNTFNPLVPEFEDRFSIAVLRPGGIAAGTVIYFTDRGWDGPNGTWLDNATVGHEAVIKWIVPAGGVAQGTEVYFIDTYHDELGAGNEIYTWAAYTTEAGVTTFGTVTTETSLPVTGMDFTFSGDNLLVYQTGPVAGPAGIYSATPIRFITGLLANLVANTTTSAGWDATPVTLNESTIPPGLVNGQTAFVMSPTALPTATVNGTSEPDNGKYNCTNSNGAACTALALSTFIYTTTNWDYNNTQYGVGLTSNHCTYALVPAITISAPTVTQPTCATPSGTIVVNATGTGTLEYQLNAGSFQLSNTFSGLTPGNYNISVRSQSAPSCVTTYASNPVVINAVPPSPVVSAPTVTQPTCAAPTGTIVVNATGTGTLEYQLNALPFQTSNTFSGLTPGNYNIVVRVQSNPACITSYSGNPVVINAATGCGAVTTTTIVSDLNPSCFGNTVTFTATVTSSSAVNEGTVTFKEGATVLAGPVAVVAGQASFSTNSLTVGGHTITAIYNGTVNFITSSGTVTQTVNGPDAVATPSSQTICSGATITTIVLTGSVNGTIFNWTRDNTGSVTGIAASGSGDISGALTNTTNAPVTVTFTITPTANSCSGAPITATVVVNPIPDGSASPSSQSRCSGLSITPIIMSGAVSGTSFNWVRDNVGTIGGSIPASGSGNISGTLINNTGSPVTVTFTITPDANGCPGTPFTATVTVNPLPAASITGGNAYVCQETDPVLTAGFDPGYTYQWGRSLFTTPYTNLGTAQTQVITTSGNYLLTVTNQYGCVDTAMTTMNVADYIFNGSLAPGDAIQTGRLNRFAVISTCAAPKACPGIFTATGNRIYDAYTITNNRNVPVCATIGVNSFCATNIFSVAYSGSYNPASLCTNYLADPGSSFTSSGFYEATIPANGTIVVIVHEVNSGTGCSGYSLTVDVPREAAGITATPSETVCSGTPVTLTASTANSYSWTPGAATTQAIVVNPPSGPSNYSVQLGYGNHGCTNNASTIVTVTSTPDVNAVADQYFCAGSTAGPITFTSTVPGTTFNWTNTNTAIGLGASGTGNIPSFIATNATAGPISGTITVTPVNGSCTGTPITFTITVSTLPSITGVTNDDVCAPGGVVNLAATGSGNINWYNASTGGMVVNSGNTYSPNITTTTTYYVEALSPPAGPVQNLAMPAQSSTFPGNVRGYWFTAPTDFVINSLSVPTTASSGPQSIAVVKFTGNTPPPVFSATTNAFITVFYTRSNPGSANIPCNIPVQAGEVIGILGYRGTINSYAPGDYNTTIFGMPVQLQRMGMQFLLTTDAPHDIWREFGPTTSISRIEFTYSNSQSCTSAPRMPVTGTVLPKPVATATPASQTLCSGPITTIVLTSNVQGTTFTWTRDNNVNVTGIPASGSGNISGTLTNNTTTPQTVTFTITPMTQDGCSGDPITATVDVQAVPTITCPANITVNNDPNQCGAVASYSPTITGIPVPTVTYTFSGATTGSGSGNGSGSFFNKGTTTVSITATNACGTANCTFTVTVVDAQSPTITCPANITKNNDIYQCGAVVTYAATVSDNCPGVSAISYSPVSGSFFPVGTTTVTASATDAVGHTSSCTFTVTVVDAQNPIITCPANITVNNTTNQCGAVVTYTATASDNCPGVSISYSPASGSFFPVGTTTVTATATDAAGRTATCTFTVKVIDAQNPTITCPANITVNNAAGLCGAFVNYTAIANDNCPGTIVTYTKAPGSFFATGTTTVTATATDAAGRTATCTFTVKVIDTQAPALTCPANVTVTISSGCSKKLTPPDPTVTDNCGLAKLTWCMTGANSGSSSSSGINYVGSKTFSVGVTTITYTATDIYGNTSECSFTVSILETVLPNITCPANKTVGTDYGYCFWSHVNLGTPTVSDNCGVLCVTNNAPDTFQLGTTVVTWTVTDNSGNTRSCNQTITVLDKQTPSVTCPANIYQNASAICITTVTAPDPTYYDNCTVAKLTWQMTGATTGSSPATGINFVGTKNYNVGTTTITYTIKDAANNSWSCSFAVTITDNTKPTITCPANITQSAAAGTCNRSILVTDPTYSDNCGVTRLTWYTEGATNISSPTSGINKIGTKTFNVGVTTVTYTAYDPWGNSKQCTFTVTVTDNQPPVATCPGAQTLCKKTNNTYTIPTLTSNDNCSIASITYQVTGVTTRSGTGSNASGTFNLGLSTITWTVTDASGNTATCSTNANIVPAGSCRLVSNEPKDDPKTAETKAPSKGKLDLIVQDSKLGITAYPNPTEYYFNVKITSQSKETVEIKMYDGLGKVVQMKRGAADQTYRFGDGVAGGIYVIEVRQGGQIATVKVMKE